MDIVKEKMYSKDFIALNIQYAKIASQKTGSDLIGTIKDLTCIRRTVLRSGFTTDPNSDTYWQKFVENPGKDPVATVFSIQSEIPPDFSPDEARVRSGRLSATLPDKAGLSLIHFSTDETELNPLSEEGLKKRAKEFIELLRQLKKYGPDNIGMFSWLLDGRFSILFPPETEYLNNPNSFYQSLAAWGQYLRADGSLNLDRARLLINNATKAKNLTELQASHPKKALQARISVPRIFEMYQVS